MQAGVKAEGEREAVDELEASEDAPSGPSSSAQASTKANTKAATKAGNKAATKGANAAVRAALKKGLSAAAKAQAAQEKAGLAKAKANEAAVKAGKMMKAAARSAKDAAKDAPVVRASALRDRLNPPPAKSGARVQFAESEDPVEQVAAKTPPPVKVCGAPPRQASTAGGTKRAREEKKAPLEGELQKAAHTELQLLAEDSDWIAFKLSKDPNWKPPPLAASSEAMFPPVTAEAPKSAPAVPLPRSHLVSEAQGISDNAVVLQAQVPKVKLELGAEQAVAHADGKIDTHANVCDRARKQRFRRMLVPHVGARESKVARCPPALALKIMAAQPKQFDTYLAMFAEAGEEWGQLEVLIRKSETSETEGGKNHVWFTLGELIEKYKEKSVAEAIFATKKVSTGSWRPHPDAPDCPAAIKVRILESEWDKNKKKNRLRGY